MSLLLVVLLPFIGTALPPLAIRRGRSWCAATTALPAAIALAIVLAHAPAVFRGEVIAFGVPWLPGLGLELAFFLDGFGFLFASLVLGIGLLIILYTRYYLSEQDSMGRFYAMLLAFMGSMLGIVLSNNLLLLVVFWELTSLTSFLLIGYWTHRSDARQGARMALVVTGAGGLCLLAGMILLGQIVGSYTLTDVLAAGDLIRAHPWYALTTLLILAGAFAKSAQVPLHFWLPHAMAAPTPVSAYLHSAAMVKAGVFLIARLFPVLSGTDLWFYTVTLVGLATMVFGAYGALFKDDLKGLLAYSTISHLGLITLFFGLGTAAGAIGGVFHIINHATFKASLFMAAGIIDHEAGTRDIRKLGGLRRYMPHTMWLATIAAAAMAGVPLLNGFLSKEMFFAEMVMEGGRFGSFGWLLPVIATVGGVLSVAYSVRFIHDVFYGKETGRLPKRPHEPPRYMRVPVEILIALCIAVGVFPSLVIGDLLRTAVGGVLRHDVPEFDLALWHGFNLPLLMSAIALAGGVLVYWQRPALERLHQRAFPALTAKRCFDALLAGTIRAAGVVVRTLDDGSLQRNVVWITVAAVAAGAIGFLGADSPIDGGANFTPAGWVSLLLWLALVVAAAATTFGHRQRLFALISASFVGLMVSLTFLYLSAPDLALTQLSVEVVTTVLMLLALNLLPKHTPRESAPWRRGRDAVLALASGLAVALASYAVMTRPQETIADYFIRHSVPGGGGHNVVNVILVDFRGYDTFGEITVLGIAAVCIYALLAGLAEKLPRYDDEERHPLILLVGSRVLLPFALVVALFIFLRGHNLPGGGFIAGLVAAVALMMQYMAGGMLWASERLLRNYFPVIGVGLLVAGATGLGSWLFGYPFLTSAYTHVSWPVVGSFELASATAFDFGVFLTVVGAVVLMLSHLGMQRAVWLRQPASSRPAATTTHTAAERDGAPGTGS